MANKPDWYPENASEIEKECLERYPISTEAKDDILNFKLSDIPNMNSLLLCIASGQNVYTPDDELEPERMAYGLYRSLHLDCDLDLVRECFDTHREAVENGNHEEFMYSSLKCVFHSATDRCVSTN